MKLDKSYIVRDLSFWMPETKKNIVGIAYVMLAGKARRNRVVN